MDIIDNWSQIKRHFSLSFASSLHVSIASVSEDGIPTVTPIGSLFLDDRASGFYFEKFTKNLNLNSKNNKQICVLGVNSNRILWIKALIKGQFQQSPALKLYGTLGIKRPATQKELARLERRMRKTKYLKGHKLLWQNMNQIRELKFHKAEKMKLGAMS